MDCVLLMTDSSLMSFDDVVHTTQVHSYCMSVCFKLCTSISVLNADRVAPSRSRTSGCTGTVLNRVPCAVLVIRAVISVPTAERLSVAL